MRSWLLVIAIFACSSAPHPVEPVTTGAPEISQHRETAAIEHMLGERVGGWDAHRVWLVDYRQDGRHVEIVGEAVSAEDITQLLRRISAEPMFADVSLGATSASGGNVRFAMTMTSTQDAPTSYAIHAWPKLPIAEPAVSALADGVTIDQLKLIGIVEAEHSKAMFTLPDGKAVIVKVGEVLADRWQVTKIAGTEVVLVRDGVEKRLHL